MKKQSPTTDKHKASSTDRDVPIAKKVKRSSNIPERYSPLTDDKSPRKTTKTRKAKTKRDDDGADVEDAEDTDSVKDTVVPNNWKVNDAVMCLKQPNVKGWFCATILRATSNNTNSVRSYLHWYTYTTLNGQIIHQTACAI